MRILFVEDDFVTAQSVQKILQLEGFICDVSDTGEDGIEVGRLYEYDAIILDLMLPDVDGFEVMRRLRASRVNTPILILSGVDDTANKVKGLSTGADDYLTKPYSREELLARINAIIRRTNGYSESVIKVGVLEINLQTRIASVNGRILPLTGKEYSILELLAVRKGSALTKEAFLNHLYGGMDEPEVKIVDVFICKLRRKLYTLTQQDGYIETIWGRGYMLRDPNQYVPVVISDESVVEGDFYGERARLKMRAKQKQRRRSKQVV
ncbi:MAG: response regulator transcription factor [Holosporales bacterium]|jgi:two-component system cell cycle response regulator CtrA|nr:response regulator transcription factor [Holosporales bacterium]